MSVIIITMSVLITLEIKYFSHKFKNGDIRWGQGGLLSDSKHL